MLLFSFCPQLKNGFTTLPSLLFRENKHLGLARLYDLLDKKEPLIKVNHWFRNLALITASVVIASVSYGGVLTWTTYVTENPVIDFSKMWVSAKAGIETYTKTFTGQGDSKVMNLSYTVPDTSSQTYIHQLQMILQNVAAEKGISAFNVSGYTTSGKRIAEIFNYPLDTASLDSAINALIKASNIATLQGNVFFKAEMIDSVPKFSIQNKVYSLETTNFKSVVEQNINAFASGATSVSDGSIYSLSVGLYTETLSPVFYEETFSSSAEALKIFNNAIPTTWDSLQGFFNANSQGKDGTGFFYAKEYPGDSVFEVVLPLDRWETNNGEQVLPCAVYYAPPAAFCSAITE